MIGIYLSIMKIRILMTIEARESYVLGITMDGYHKISYVEWGDPNSEKVVMCVHGMSRNGRDFDYLAKELVKIGYRVVCPDLPGRGRSDWHKNPENYNTPKNIQEMLTLIARLNIEKLDWIGTSMGGIIGMILSAYPNSPIQKLVMNDVGPFIPAKPLQKIIKYLSLTPTFSAKNKAQRYLQQLLTPFGPLRDEHLDHLVEHGYFINLEGKLQLSYDPQILSPVKAIDVNLWYMWETVNIPVLVLRGADSEILTLDILDRMLQKENVSAIEFLDVAHAPALMEQNQIDFIINWLEK